MITASRPRHQGLDDLLLFTDKILHLGAQSNGNSTPPYDSMSSDREEVWCTPPSEDKSDDNPLFDVPDFGKEPPPSCNEEYVSTI